MKCLICEKRKGKRHCPAKNGYICPICCGEKRGVEINCPLDCTYYVEGQKYQQEKVSRQRLRKEGVGSFIRRAEMYNKNPEIFNDIEIAFVNVFRTNNRIRNVDLAEGLGLVLKTLDTEKRGLVYDHRSENSFANEISDRVIKIIREYKDNIELGKSRISIDYGREIVQEFLNEVEFFIENEVNPRSYFIHILRYHPQRVETSQGAGNIILAS
ncbi:MAG: hypothetical protein WBD99_15530 [Thermodesulfobacteriota bacterium]